MIEEKKADYIKRAAKMVNLPEEEIVSLLKAKFKSFKPSEISTYTTYLYNVSDKRFEEVMARKEVVDVSCPYHPDATTKGSLKWYSPYTKTSGWMCSEGGDRCFIRSRIDDLQVFRGGEPIDWVKFDENKDEILKARLENA